LDAIRAWVPWAYKYLTAGGVFVTEIGTGQSPKVSAIMTAAGFTAVEVANDLAGHDRVVSAIKK
jgi:methylase of polypeptide subunit release factors